MPSYSTTRIVLLFTSSPSTAPLSYEAHIYVLKTFVNKNEKWNK